MEYRNNIALITCYIGKLPWYFHYFVHSCSYNPSIDFFIFTDDNTRIPVPGNVKVIYKTLDDIVKLATAKLNLEINITNGYKLCDFKPAYGLIFSDILSGYDFWGHCDIDIIFGNIRSFITDDLLARHDLISVRHDWLSGCFLLYQNTHKLNHLFLHSKDYKKVFGSSQHYCFDETNFAHDAFTNGMLYTDVETEIESMTHVVKKLEARNYISPFFDFLIIEGLPGRLRWDNGEMFYRNRYEVLFYHLIYFKRLPNLPKKVVNIPQSFTISPSKIYHQYELKKSISELETH
ncbi:DUF6625 family protein [Mucilaginibacter angelicae]|uniref:DUF6625 family protein n=1 Tax=Mucilaginibacter angelicae TaxID=869718 RepID=A0ABV6L388_9SPHI